MTLLRLKECRSFLPLNGSHQLGGQDAEAKGHVRQVRQIQEGEEALKHPVADQLDLGIAVEGAAADPARGGHDAGGILLLLGDQQLHLVRVGFHVAGHDDDMTAARHLEGVTQRATQVGQLLMHHDDEIAELPLQIANRFHRCSGRSPAHDDQQLPDELRWHITQNDAHRLLQRGRLVDHRQNHRDGFEPVDMSVLAHGASLGAAVGRRPTRMLDEDHVTPK